MRILILSLLLVLLPASALAQSPAQTGAAEALFAEGRAALERGDLETACARLAASDRLEPSFGARGSLGECEERRGRVVAAWAAFRSALDTIPAGDARRAAAEARIAALAPRLPRLVLQLAPGAPAGTTVREGDAVLGASGTWGVPLPLDPGRHVLVVGQPGQPPRTVEVTLVEGKVTALAVGAVDAPVPPPERRERPAQAQRAEGPVPGQPDRAARPPLSHHLQPGAVARVDIDGMRAGAVFAPGLTLGLGDRVELVGTALLGRNKGGELGAEVYILTGTWKPLVYLGVPIFAIEGARVGIHGAAGIQWDVSRHFGAFAMVGATGMTSMPEGAQRVTFLPSIGVQGRL